MPSASARRLPVHLQAQALLLIKEDELPRVAGRRPEDRRLYVGDPWAYFRDILGIEYLWRGQEEALAAFEAYDRVLVPSGNALGKTLLLAGYAIYRFDAVAALRDEDWGLEEQGARILLPGPSSDTVKNTVYAEMLALMSRAELRGHQMPGRRSEDSVLCKVRPMWEVESFSPPRRVHQSVAHTASGRHHRNQVALIEEGQGVEESLWKAVEGMCSSAGNKIISTFNPTEAVGPAWQRSRQNGWHVLHLDAFDHPNVQQRQLVIPAAIDFKIVDARVAECLDLGAKGVCGDLDDLRGDFWYALPPHVGAPEHGTGREDGVPGHPDGAVHLWRPQGAFQAQVRGVWPSTSTQGLFNPADLDAAERRWRESHPPSAQPDRVGVDLAREGDDEIIAAPAWGMTAAQLIRAHYQGERLERLRIGMPETLPPGRGPQVAVELHRRWPQVPMTVDEGGVGGSPYDHLVDVLHHPADPVSFSGTPPAPLPHEPVLYNLRAALFYRFATLCRLGLVDLPPDPLLREELLAHNIRWLQRSVADPQTGAKEKKDAIAIEEKDQVKRRIGRSPDRADGVVLAAHEPFRPGIIHARGGSARPPGL